MTTPRSSGRLLTLAVALCGLHLLSCFAAPEACRQCNEAVHDGSMGGEGGPAFEGSGGAAAGGNGGQVGTGGRPGSGGAVPTGGSSGATGGTGSGGGAPSGGSGPGGAGAGGTGGVGAATSGGAIGSGGAGAVAGIGGRASGSGGATGGSGMVSGSGGSSSGGAGGRGGTGAGGAGVTDPDLVLWYKFDESGGMTAADSAMFGGTGRAGTLTNVSTGTASFSTTAKVGSHSVSLTGTGSTVGGYVSVPDLSAVAPSALTIACWVYTTADQTWQRVFDFGKAPASGASPGSYMFLTTHQGSRSPASVRFAITTNENFNEESIEMSTPAVPSLNAWHHFAVTLGAGSPYTGTLYIDRAVAGANTAMTHHWSDLGVTDANHFGRSAFTADPYFAGMLDDCRVYRRALSAAEIAALP